VPRFDRQGSPRPRFYSTIRFFILQVIPPYRKHNDGMGRQKLFTREDVLDKTIPMFWKHGYAETKVQNLEQATGVNKSGLYAEFGSKEDLFVASLNRYLKVVHERGTLTKQPLGWDNVEDFLKLCHGSWGQKGCFSVNSMREFSDLPLGARESMIESVMQFKKQLVRNLSASRQRSGDNDVLASLIITFFCGICVEQNLNPSERQIASKIENFMQLIRTR
jgi:TetR/AcrR family transcriptional regulator, copper-responsive repressor